MALCVSQPGQGVNGTEEIRETRIRYIIMADGSKGQFEGKPYRHDKHPWVLSASVPVSRVLLVDTRFGITFSRERAEQVNWNVCHMCTHLMMAKQAPTTRSHIHQPTGHTPGHLRLGVFDGAVKKFLSATSLALVCMSSKLVAACPSAASSSSSSTSDCGSSVDELEDDDAELRSFSTCSSRARSASPSVHTQSCNVESGMCSGSAKAKRMMSARPFTAGERV